MARCAECGNPIEDGLDNEFCLDCEPDQRVYCSICGETYWDDDTCRHVFETDEGWAGPGVIGGNLRYVSTGLFRLLDKTDLAAPLREALALNQFSMNSIGNTFFGICEVEIWLNGKSYRFDEEIFRNEPYRDLLKTGFRWLFSLEPARTDEARKMTIRWIDQYFLQTEE